MTTARLELVPFAPTHLEFLHGLFITPLVRRYLFDDGTISAERTESLIEESAASFEAFGFGFWVIEKRAEAEPHRAVGFVGLRKFGEHEEIELLYGLAPAEWGSGIATEAARRVLDFARDELGITRILAGADTENASSFRVMQRLGMSPDSVRTIDGVEVEYFA